LPDLGGYDWDLFLSLLHRVAPVNAVIAVEPFLVSLDVPIRGEREQEGHFFPALSDRANKPIVSAVNHLVTGNQDIYREEVPPKQEN
jgi:hypothetical protein